MLFSIWPDSPPSEYALRLRPYAMAIVILQFLLLPGRFLEIWGGIMLLLVCGLGYAVVWGQPPMAPRWVTLWGPICFMNSILDTMFGIIKLSVLYRKHTLTPNQDDPVKEKNGGASLGNLPMWVVWWVCITLILVPISEGLGAFISYKLYKDFSAREDFNGSFGQQFLPQGGLQNGRTQQYGSPSENDDYMTFNYNRPQQSEQPSFIPFSGPGHQIR